MTQFGDLLRRLRERASLSQKALAEQVGIHPSHLNRVERGLRNPPKTATLLAIADALMLGKDQRLDLLEAAGRRPPVAPSGPLPSSRPRPDRPVAFASPLAPGVDIEHPTVRVVAETLADDAISVQRRKQIAEQIKSFALWLRQQARTPPDDPLAKGPP